MEYREATIDVHKSILAVVVADAAAEGPYEFQRRKFGTRPGALKGLAQWLDEQNVEEVVMESTAQYWKPVWGYLEQIWRPLRRNREGAPPKAGMLHLCQAKSNRGTRGRKNDFADAERMFKRHVAQELKMSFVPDPEQRMWRAVTRRRLQLTAERTQLIQKLESFLETGYLKLSSIISDLKGVSGRRMLKAIAAGEKDPEVLAAMKDKRLRATPEQLADALSACRTLPPVFRRVLQQILDELELKEEHIQQLEREAMELMEPHQEAIRRLAEVPGLGANSAVQIMAEVGPTAGAFESAKALASWVGVCPGEEQSAGESKNNRSPKGNRFMRRLLDQAAQSAVKVKGSVFEISFHRRRRHMERQEAIWAEAHRLCRIVWAILHKGVQYEERGPAVSAKSKQRRTARMIKELTRMGYRVLSGPASASIPA